jgi:hypothetical protein
VNTQATIKPDKPQRRWDLDWLRVIGTMLLYEIARRWGVTRFLFGLKKKGR